MSICVLQAPELSAGNGHDGHGALFDVDTYEVMELGRLDRTLHRVLWLDSLDIGQAQREVVYLCRHALRRTASGRHTSYSFHFARRPARCLGAERPGDPSSLPRARHVGGPPGRLFHVDHVRKGVLDGTRPRPLGLNLVALSAALKFPSRVPRSARSTAQNAGSPFAVLDMPHAAALHTHHIPLARPRAPHVPGITAR